MCMVIVSQEEWKLEQKLKSKTVFVILKSWKTNTDLAGEIVVTNKKDLFCKFHRHKLEGEKNAFSCVNINKIQ